MGKRRGEEWLQNVGNVVDEEVVVDLLETASNYKCGLTWLTSQQKVLIEKLKELGHPGWQGHKNRSTLLT